MPRKVRDATLETRTARSRLRAAGKPYFRLIEPGLHLGYRRLASGPGTWVVRRYTGDGKYKVENLRTSDERVVLADDFSEPNGATVLSFGQAQERAKAFRAPDAEHPGTYLVRDAMADYFAYLESNRKPTRTARSHDRVFINPHFGSIEAAKLPTTKIRHWLGDIAKQAPRARTGEDQPQNYREMGDDDEAARRRQATANRILTTLKAALNRAWRDGRIASDTAWRRVEPFNSVDSARIRYLTIPESKRLINACAPDFRKIVQAALQTGARWGQLARMAVSAFDPDSGTVQTSTRKGRGKEKIYHIVLTDEGKRFFVQACAGLGSGELIFRKSDGLPWNETDQARPMADACARAKIKPPIGFHGLRHTWASHSTMNGMPLMVVAKNLGHSDTRMVEKHYAHLAPTYIADAIRAGAPKFGFKAGNVAAMESRR
jgi:integrase